MLLLVLLLVVLIGSVAVWARVIQCWQAGIPLVRWRRWQDRPWGLADLIVVATFLVLAQGLVGLGMSSQFGFEPDTKLEDMTSDQRAVFLAGSAAATLGSLTFAVAWLALRYQTKTQLLGIDVKRIKQDAVLGLQAFFFLAPIVYGLQLILVQWAESKHPLMELLRENPDSKFIILSAFSALFVAPVAEEVFFRLLIQGWLERLVNGNVSPWEAVWGGYATEKPASVNRNISPVLISAALFGLAHYTHGPDPIPLFVLAIGLGVLYQRTHRITACIVVHFLLNLCSLVVLLLSLYSEAV